MQEMQVLSLSQEISLEEGRTTTSVFLPGESHGQRSLAGYGTWGQKRVRHDLATKYHHQLLVVMFILVIYLRWHLPGYSVIGKFLIQRYLGISPLQMFNFMCFIMCVCVCVCVCVYYFSKMVNAYNLWVTYLYTHSAQMLIFFFFYW